MKYSLIVSFLCILTSCIFRHDNLLHHVNCLQTMTCEFIREKSYNDSRLVPEITLKSTAMVQPPALEQNFHQAQHNLHCNVILAYTTLIIAFHYSLPIWLHPISTTAIWDCFLSTAPDNALVSMLVFIKLAVDCFFRDMNDMNRKNEFVSIVLKWQIQTACDLHV